MWTLEESGETVLHWVGVGGARGVEAYEYDCAEAVVGAAEVGSVVTVYWGGFGGGICYHLLCVLLRCGWLGCLVVGRGLVWCVSWSGPWLVIGSLLTIVKRMLW